jgi:hypothetical protein
LSPSPCGRGVRGEGRLTANPKQILVPFSRIKKSFPFGDVPAQLQQRTVIGEVAVIEREDEGAVVGAVDGHLACGGVDEVGEVFDGGRNR